MEGTVTLFALIALGAYLFYKQKTKISILKQEYDDALKGNDRRVALEAGRKYYSAMRRNQKLTIYDEQAITNDLTTMTDFKA